MNLFIRGANVCHIFSIGGVRIVEVILLKPIPQEVFFLVMGIMVNREFGHTLCCLYMICMYGYAAKQKGGDKLEIENTLNAMQWGNGDLLKWDNQTNANHPFPYTISPMPDAKQCTQK